MDLITHIILTRKLIGRSLQIVAAGVVPDAPLYLTYPAWLLVPGTLRRWWRTSGRTVAVDGKAAPFVTELPGSAGQRTTAAPSCTRRTATITKRGRIVPAQP